ncbi:hypothetical protein [Poriferisphaera sp. WC338]|uniref:hypothetical protein n=1 Tax=Poriferisphaera sp. WC338 TaxID=3425129 RepID=UPI003D813015
MSKHKRNRDADQPDDKDLYELADTQEEEIPTLPLDDDPRFGPSSKSKKPKAQVSQPNEDERPDTAPKELRVYCLKCAHDLKGLPAGACPECGREFNPEVPSTISRTPIPIDNSFAEGWGVLFGPLLLLVGGLVFFFWLPYIQNQPFYLFAVTYPIWFFASLFFFLRAVKYNKTSVKMFIMVLIGIILGAPLHVVASVIAAGLGAIAVLVQDRTTMQ